MPDYYVYVTCQECGETHSAQIRVFLGDGPDEQMSIEEAYRDKPLPASIQTLLDNNICICPKSGGKFKQTDPQKVFLRRQIDPEPPKEIETDAKASFANQGAANFLEALAETFLHHPGLPQTERQQAAVALKAIARKPVSMQIVSQVLTMMLFGKD